MAVQSWAIVVLSCHDTCSLLALGCCQCQGQGPHWRWVSRSLEQFTTATLSPLTLGWHLKAILVTECWARSWSRCIGSQPAGCHCSPPGLQSPSQLKNGGSSTVPSYTACWLRHTAVNNLPKVVTQLCPGENWLQVQRLTAKSPAPPTKMVKKYWGCKHLHSVCGEGIIMQV